MKSFTYAIAMLASSLPLAANAAVIQAPTVEQTVSLASVTHVAALRYGPVKCTPRGCHEEIRPW